MKFLKALSWIINIIVFLLAALIRYMIVDIKSLGPTYASGGMAVLAPGIILFFVFPIGLLLNFVLLYFEHKKHLPTKLTIITIFMYIAYFIYTLLGGY